jgi:hypothetical protein
MWVKWKAEAPFYRGLNADTLAPIPLKVAPIPERREIALSSGKSDTMRKKAKAPLPIP